MLSWITKNANTVLIPFCDLKTLYHLSLLNKVINERVNQDITTDMKYRALTCYHKGSWAYNLNIYFNLSKMTICHMFGLFESWKAALFYLPPFFFQNKFDLVQINISPIISGGNADIWWNMLKKVCFIYI